MPAARTRSLSAGSKAPRSQNTSIQRLCGAQARSISPQTRSTYSVAAIGVLGRHDVRAEEGHLRRHLGGEPREPRLVVDGEPVAGLDLERRRALGAQLGDEPGEAGAQLVVGRGAGRGHRPPYAARGIRRARHARLELVGAVAAEDEVGVAVDEARDDGPAAGVDDLDVPCSGAIGRGRDPRSAPPTHAIRSPSISTAASRSVPHGSPSAATFVVSSPMFVISVALTASAPSGRARARPPSRGRSRRRRGA